MKNTPQKEKNQFNRRGFLPILGLGFLLPLFGFGKPSVEVLEIVEEYQTLLRPDGTTVKVKKSVVEKSQVVEHNVSNKSLLEWLKPNK